MFHLYFAPTIGFFFLESDSIRNMETHGNKNEIIIEKLIIHKENISTWVPS